jgi:DNA (cytosine-5)-methyltransferase 1
MIKERIDIQNIEGQLFEIKVIEPDDSKPASFTHYLHNHTNGISQFYKKDALAFVKEILAKEYPKDEITNKIAEEALQYLIFDLSKTVPFPSPVRPEFKFIDLFAGIGEIPFGDISKGSTKNFIPQECFSFQSYPQNDVLSNLANSKLYMQAS